MPLTDEEFAELSSPIKKMPSKEELKTFISEQAQSIEKIVNALNQLDEKTITNIMKKALSSTDEQVLAFEVKRWLIIYERLLTISPQKSEAIQSAYKKVFSELFAPYLRYQSIFEKMQALRNVSEDDDNYFLNYEKEKHNVFLYYLFAKNHEFLAKLGFSLNETIRLNVKFKTLFRDKKENFPSKFITPHFLIEKMLALTGSASKEEKKESIVEEKAERKVELKAEDKSERKVELKSDDKKIDEKPLAYRAAFDKEFLLFDAMKRNRVFEEKYFLEKIEQNKQQWNAAKYQAHDNKESFENYLSHLREIHLNSKSDVIKVSDDEWLRIYPRKDKNIEANVDDFFAAGIDMTQGAFAIASFSPDKKAALDEIKQAFHVFQNQMSLETHLKKASKSTSAFSGILADILLKHHLVKHHIFNKRNRALKGIQEARDLIWLIKRKDESVCTLRGKKGEPFEAVSIARRLTFAPAKKTAWFNVMKKKHPWMEAFYKQHPEVLTLSPTPMQRTTPNPSNAWNESTLLMHNGELVQVISGIRMGITSPYQIEDDQERQILTDRNHRLFVTKDRLKSYIKNHLVNWEDGQTKSILTVPILHQTLIDPGYIRYALTIGGEDPSNMIQRKKAANDKLKKQFADNHYYYNPMEDRMIVSAKDSPPPGKEYILVQFILQDINNGVNLAQGMTRESEHDKKDSQVLRDIALEKIKLFQDKDKDKAKDIQDICRFLNGESNVFPTEKINAICDKLNRGEWKDIPLLTQRNLSLLIQAACNLKMIPIDIAWHQHPGRIINSFRNYAKDSNDRTYKSCYERIIAELIGARVGGCKSALDREGEVAEMTHAMYRQFHKEGLIVQFNAATVEKDRFREVYANTQHKHNMCEMITGSAGSTDRETQGQFFLSESKEERKASELLQKNRKLHFKKSKESSEKVRLLNLFSEYTDFKQYPFFKEGELETILKGADNAFFMSEEGGILLNSFNQGELSFPALREKLKSQSKKNPKLKDALDYIQLRSYDLQRLYLNHFYEILKSKEAIDQAIESRELFKPGINLSNAQEKGMFDDKGMLTNEAKAMVKDGGQLSRLENHIMGRFNRSVLSDRDYIILEAAIMETGGRFLHERPTQDIPSAQIIKQLCNHDALKALVTYGTKKEDEDKTLAAHSYLKKDQLLDKESLKFIRAFKEVLKESSRVTIPSLLLPETKMLAQKKRQEMQDKIMSWIDDAKNTWIAKLGQYERKEEKDENYRAVRNILDDSKGDVYKELYKGCSETSSITAREKFTRYLADVLKNHSMRDPGSAPIKMKKLLGKQGVKLYKEALREEYESREFRRATFLASTQFYSGPKWIKKLVIWSGGPSASGKSFYRDWLIKKVMGSQYIEKNNADLSGNYIVSVDGGVERSVSQVRKLALQAALLKGYRGIKDLEKQSKLKDVHKKEIPKIKSYIHEAADKHSALNLVIPATFIKGFYSTIQKIAGYAKEKNVQQIFNQVTGGPTKEDHKRFKATVEYQGNDRAWYKGKKGKGWFNVEDFDINRDPPCESKKRDNNFNFGVFFSKLAGRYYKWKQHTHNKPILDFNITNDSVFMRKNSDKGNKWERCDAEYIGSDVVIRITQRGFDDWQKVKKDYPDLESWWNGHCDASIYMRKNSEEKNNWERCDSKYADHDPVIRITQSELDDWQKVKKYHPDLSEWCKHHGKKDQYTRPLIDKIIPSTLSKEEILASPLYVKYKNAASEEVRRLALTLLAHLLQAYKDSVVPEELKSLQDKIEKALLAYNENKKDGLLMVSDELYNQLIHKKVLNDEEMMLLKQQCGLVIVAEPVLEKLKLDESKIRSVSTTSIQYQLEIENAIKQLEEKIHRQEKNMSEVAKEIEQAASIIGVSKVHEFDEGLITAQKEKTTFVLQWGSDVIKSAYKTLADHVLTFKEPIYVYNTLPEEKRRLFFIIGLANRLDMKDAQGKNITPDAEMQKEIEAFKIKHPEYLNLKIEKPQSLEKVDDKIILWCQQVQQSVLPDVDNLLAKKKLNKNILEGLDNDIQSGKNYAKADVPESMKLLVKGNLFEMERRRKTVEIELAKKNPEDEKTSIFTYIKNAIMK